MFYQYSSPKYFYQRLHNKVGTTIFKTGQFLGFLWIQIGADGQTITFGSKILLIWSIIASIIQFVPFSCYIIYYMLYFRENEPGSTVLSVILSSIADIFYGTFTVVTYGSLTFGRRCILKVFIFSKDLKNRFSTWETDKNINYKKKLLYIVCGNIVLGACFDIIIVIILLVNFFLHPSWHLFFFALFESEAWASFFFVVLIYSIPFTYGLFMLQKMLDNLSPENGHHISMYHYLLLKFLRKINCCMQMMIAFLFLEGFVGLVSEVSSTLPQESR